MRTGVAFLTMLALAALAAVAVVKLSSPPSASSVPRAPATASSLVLAGHPATWALADALAAGTTLQVVPAWPPGAPWHEQAEFARAPGAEWQALARRALAVVTLRHGARGDVLFAAVRALNPRIVELDASVGEDQRAPSVRLRADHAGGPAFALSPGNAMRLAERIAADFSALHPAGAEVIAENLRMTKERLLRLKATYDQAFARVAAAEVAVFSADFDYLCEDFGLQVVARFDSDAGRDPESLLGSLRRSGARVSLHAFPPNPELAAALARAGVTPVVLDPLQRSASAPGEFFSRLEANLAAMKTALGP